MKAEVLAVGTEILLGEIVDTNSAYIASRLPSLGIILYRITQLGDNKERLVRHLQGSLEDNDLVITTGGLGPTEDDVTREAVAAAVGETPMVDPSLESALRAWFARRQVTMPERNVKQAWLLPSGTSLANPRGTAPGWWVEKNGKLIVSLPGPPAEMRPMWETQVEPRLLERASEVIVTRTLKTVGVGEGRVDELLTDLLSSANPTVGIYSRPDGIHVRLGARAASREGALQVIEPVEAQMRTVLGSALWGTDEETLQQSVMHRLASRQMTLAVVEDGVMGGLLASVLTQVDSSIRGRVWRGSEVWSTSVVSAEVAVARSASARIRHGSRIGVGVAVDEAAGTFFVAVSDADSHEVVHFTFAQALSALRQRVATAALGLLRRRYCM